jgi:hypothetical protein
MERVSPCKVKANIDSIKFAGIRRLVSMWNCSLTQLNDIKIEHDKSREKLLESLSDIEMFLSEKGVSVELCHLVNHADFLDDDRVKFYRKKILDHGNNLKREAEAE